MKEPNLKDLVYDEKGTKEIRRMVAKSNGKIKITINMDRDTIDKLKFMADKTGASYQKLMNKLLKESLMAHNDTSSRLAKLEKDVKILKRKSA